MGAIPILKLEPNSRVVKSVQNWTLADIKGVLNGGGAKIIQAFRFI